METICLSKLSAKYPTSWPHHKPNSYSKDLEAILGQTVRDLQWNVALRQFYQLVFWLSLKYDCLKQSLCVLLTQNYV